MTVEEQLNAIIVDMLEVEEVQIIPSARFREDLDADSLDLMEMIMEIEEKFGEEISDEDAQHIKTVGDAYAYIHARQSQAD